MASITPKAAAGVTPETFAEQLLRGVGAPIDAGTVGFVEAWESAEGGNWANTARFNPLNTTLPEPGAVPYQPGAGVKAYTSWSQGLQATLSTVLEPAYRSVVAALRNDNPSGAQEALAASPWDAGHYAGGFPTSSAGAAYAKAHSDGKSKGGGGFLGGLGDVVKNPIGAIGGAVGGAAGDVAGAAASEVAKGFGAALAPIWADSKNFFIRLSFVGLGVGLIVIGGYETAKPVTARLTAAGEKAAPLVAAAA